MGLRELWQGAQRLGSAIWRRVGDTSKAVGLAGARFVSQHHQPLSLLAKSIADQTGNPFLQAAGNLAVSASSAYGMRQRMAEQSEMQRQANRAAAARAGYRYGGDDT